MNDKPLDIGAETNETLRAKIENTYMLCLKNAREIEELKRMNVGAKEPLPTLEDVQKIYREIRNGRSDAEMNLEMVLLEIERTDEGERGEVRLLGENWARQVYSARKPSRDLFVRLLHARLMVEQEKEKAK